MDIPRLPRRPADGHKGIFGTIAIMGGHISSHEVMLGSASFAAKAALRSGVGMVGFLGSKALLVPLLAMVPQAIGYRIEENPLHHAHAWDALIIGPGIGRDSSNVPIISSLLKLKLPTTIDADALNILASHPKLAQFLHDQCILTPHHQEFERLTEAFGLNTTSHRAANHLAKEFGCTIVQKSHHTYITNGTRSWELKEPNAVLATAGSGDVLAGLIGGLTAQRAQNQLSVFDCAQLGVTIHSQAANIWKEHHGSRGMLMNEFIDLLPQAIEQLRQKA